MIPDIASALAARLGAWADAEGISVAWDNVPFTPPANEMYLAVVALAGRVAELFPEGQEIAGKDFTCWIISAPGIFRGVPTPVSYTVPVSLNYRADITS